MADPFGKGFGCRYAAKVPARVLQQLMRHANIKTTMDSYANIDGAVEEAVLGGRPNNLPNTTRNLEPGASRTLGASPLQERINSPSGS